MLCNLSSAVSCHLVQDCTAYEYQQLELCARSLLFATFVVIVVPNDVVLHAPTPVHSFCGRITGKKSGALHTCHCQWSMICIIFISFYALCNNQEPFRKLLWWWMCVQYSEITFNLYLCVLPLEVLELSSLLRYLNHSKNLSLECGPKKILLLWRYGFMFSTVTVFQIDHCCTLPAHLLKHWASIKIYV